MKKQLTPAHKTPLEDYFGIGIISVMLAANLILFIITIYKSIF